MGVRVFSPVNATFVHMEKTGGSSIQRWLVVNTKSEKFNKHAGVPYIRKTFADPGLLFTVIRNPYERVVSWYFYIMHKTQSRVDAVRDGITITGNKKKLENKYNLEKNLQILNNLKKGFDNYVKNSPLKSQYYNARPCDIILRLENIQQDFIQIQDLFGVHEPLHHLNKSVHNHYSKYYTEETKKIVYEKYRIDFENYGYTFEDK